MYDLKIINATIVDGTGAPSYQGELGVTDGRITAIGQAPDDAKHIIDAQGLVLSPGFVDVHTHYDAQVFWDKTVSPSCYHGVTTIFGGHCGFSIAPLSSDAAPYLLNMLARVEGMPVASLQEGVPWDWTSFAEYLEKLDGNLGVNAGFMAGHSAIRRVVMGDRAVGHQATPEEISAMQTLLANSLEEGAMGFSSTVAVTHNDADGQPVPSRHATKDEMIALASVCKDFEGTSLEFLPAVGEFSDEVIELMVALTTSAQRPLNWNALSAGNPKVMENQLSASDRALAAGGDIRALTIPQPITIRINLYTGFVFDALEGWADIFKLPIDERIALLKDPEQRRRLDESANQPGNPFRGIARWSDMKIHAAFLDKNKHLEGKTMGELAEGTNKSPFDIMLDLAIEEGLRTFFMPKGSDTDPALWKVRAELWQDERTVIGDL